MTSSIKNSGGGTTLCRKSQKRIDSLAGLKVVAMLAIFWWHSGLPNFGIDLGARSCEFFFVVSGFLVMYNHCFKPINTNIKTAISYTYDKICKMWPLHLLCFIVMFFYTLKEFSGTYIVKAILNVFLVQAWSPNLDVAMSFNGVSWFLSAILFCYFLTPFLLKLLKNKKSAIVSLIVGLILRVGLEFVSRNFMFPFYKIQVHTNPIIRCLEYFLGMATAYFFICHKSFSKKIVSSIVEIAIVVLISVAVIVPVFFDIKPFRAVYVVLFCIAVFVFASDNGILSKALSIKPFEWLSNVQFEFFMLHSVVLKCFKSIIAFANVEMNWLLVIILSFVIGIGLSFMYKQFFSKAFTKIMKKIKI